MKYSSRSTLVLLLLLLASASPAPAQVVPSSFSAWIGGATDRFEETLPFSPQLGARFEMAPAGFLWVGAEATGLFVDEGVSCPDEVGIDCDDDTSLSVTPTLSAQVRLEAGGAAVRPYATGLLGRAIRGTNVSSTVLGVGAGVRFPDRLVAEGVSVEIRYRDDDRFSSLSYDHWELFFGISL